MTVIQTEVKTPNILQPNTSQPSNGNGVGFSISCPEDLAFALLERGGTQSGSEITFCCPFHDDNRPSASYNEEKHVFHCKACGAGHGQSWIDLAQKIGDVRKIDPANYKFEKLKPLYIEDFFTEKELPREFLESEGVKQDIFSGTDCVSFQYYGEDGTPLYKKFRGKNENNKYRLSHAENRVPYGLNHLAHAKKANYIIICEGESDSLTLWFNGYPAIGIPGADAWKPEYEKYFSEIEKVYVSVEPDQGGDKFLDSLLQSKLKDKLWVISWKDAGFKDTSELHIHNPEAFKEEFQGLLDKATNLSDIPAAQQARKEKATEKTWYYDEDSEELFEIVLRGSKPEFVTKRGSDYVYVDSIQTKKGAIKPLSGSHILDGDTPVPEQPEVYGSFDALFYECKTFVEKYLCLDLASLLITITYIFLTWVFERFSVVPYMRARGDFGSGKSRFLQVLAALCLRSVNVAGCLSEAVAFRLVDKLEGTVIIDEADFQFSDADAPIVKMLNCGYQEGTKIYRCASDTFDPQSYKVFGPKILGTRRNFKDQALESRCLTIDMEGKYHENQNKNKIPKRLPREFKQEAKKLRNKLLAWRLDNFNLVDSDYSYDNEELEPRLIQIIEPLLAIAPSEEVQEAIIAKAKSVQESIAVDRSSQLPAEILRVMIWMYEDTGKARQKIGSIRQHLRKELVALGYEEAQIPTARKVGDIIKHVLKFEKTKKLRGTYWVIYDPEKIEAKKRAFGIGDVQPPRDILKAITEGE